MASDVRRRRAERVRQQRLKTSLPRYAPWIALAAVLILVVGVLAFVPGILPTGAPAKKFVHHHASFGVFINGEQVSMRDPAYDLDAIGQMSSHLHVRETGGGAIIHLEASFSGGVPDITLERFFRVHGMEFRQGHFKLDTKAGHNGSSIDDGGNATWRMYASKFDPKVANATRGPYEPIAGDYSQYAPFDLDKVLITYGTDEFLTPAELARQQGLIPVPPGEPRAS